MHRTHTFRRNRLLFFPLDKWTNSNAESLNNLPQVTQLGFQRDYKWFLLFDFVLAYMFQDFHGYVYFYNQNNNKETTLKLLNFLMSASPYIYNKD